MMIADMPTLTLTAARASGQLSEHRQLNATSPQPPTINSALRDLFMAVMAFYCERSHLAMPLPLVKTLDLAAVAIHSHRAELLVLHLVVEIVERSVVAGNQTVQAALQVAYTTLTTPS